MHSSIPNNRRTNRKTGLVEFCPVTFEYSGKDYGGFLVDISGEGARITIPDEGTGPRFHPEDKLHLNIRTPYGLSDSTAQVRWAHQNDRTVEVGLKFVQMTEHSEEPIRELTGSQA